MRCIVRHSWTAASVLLLAQPWCVSQPSESGHQWRSLNILLAFFMFHVWSLEITWKLVCTLLPTYLIWGQVLPLFTLIFVTKNEGIWIYDGSTNIMCYFSLCYIPKLLKPLMADLFSPSWCVRTFQWKMWQRPDSFLCSATFWTSQVMKARFNTPLLKRDLWFYWSFWLSCIFLKESHWTELALIVTFSRFFLFVFFILLVHTGQQVC